MLLIELLERNASDLGIRELINKADDELSGGAARAITGFIGHEPGKVDQDLDDFSSIGFMYSDMLERNEFAKEIEQAFAPVRNKLKSMMGNTITLYRAQHPVEAGTEARNYLSWTSDKDFAMYHVGVRKKIKPQYTEQEIKNFEREFKENGVVKITGTSYSLKLEHQKMYNWNDELIEFDMISIYQGKEHITDTDSVRDFVNGINKDRADDEAENTKKSERIIKAEVPLNDVIWVSDRAGQSEFIVKNYQGSSSYIDPTGKH